MAHRKSLHRCTATVVYAIDTESSDSDSHFQDEDSDWDGGSESDSDADDHDDGLCLTSPARNKRIKRSLDPPEVTSDDDAKGSDQRTPGRSVITPNQNPVLRTCPANTSNNGNNDGNNARFRPANISDSGSGSDDENSVVLLTRSANSSDDENNDENSVLLRLANSSDDRNNGENIVLLRLAIRSNNGNNNGNNSGNNDNTNKDTNNDVVYNKRKRQKRGDSVFTRKIPTKATKQEAIRRVAKKMPTVPLHEITNAHRWVVQICEEFVSEKHDEIEWEPKTLVDDDHGVYGIEYVRSQKEDKVSCGCGLLLSVV